MQLCVASAFLCSASAVRNLRSSVVDLGADGGADASEAVAGVWVPVHPEGEQMYWYNPVQGVSVLKLPAGAVATGALQVPNGTMPTIVPLEKRKSCVPHCAWKCTEPVCEQDCDPKCSVPQCETRCPKAAAAGDWVKGCKVQCGEPNCAMFCPNDPCEGKKTLDCQTPKCTTKCEKPKCALQCPHDVNMGCTTVCHEPQCEWHCRKPKDCPHPKCTMACEQAPDCGATSGVISVPPPLDPGMEKVGNSRTATKKKIEWTIGDWGVCSTRCGDGQQTRRVECSDGQDGHCPGPRPPTSRTCTSSDACRYDVGEWSECSARCGPGTKTRKVTCNGPACHEDKPDTKMACTGHAETCDQCTMTVWGGKGFNGWERSFPVGEYSSAELEYQGVKCDDVSSLQVVGDFCEAVTYEFGDFNKLHPGWSAVFHQGRYDAHEIESAGAKNNDISSFKVRQLPHAKAPDTIVPIPQFPGAGQAPGVQPKSGAATAGAVGGLLLALAVWA
mmetsp:Transcript_102179/g.234132  ORF Transcript_102179/g.234132 Transcript_102179/m.234132 type:complete len:500 (+) Transcript_102179:84-1583(+)